MSFQKRALLLAAFALMPSRAAAHGTELLVMVLYVPPLIVPCVYLLAWWPWRTDLRTKVVTFVGVVIASGAMFALNFGIQARAIPFPFGDSAYLLVLGAQVLVPALAWYGCYRAMTKHRPEALGGGGPSRP